MKIQYMGHSCFQFQFLNGATLITDPYTRIGYEMPKNITADIVTVSHEHYDHNYIKGINGKPVIVRSVKDCIVNGVEIRAIETSHDEKNGALRGKNTVYIFKADGFTVCHMGDVGEPCTTALIEKIGTIDILLIPIGGTYTIDALQAKDYITALKPKLVIPMHYRPSDGTVDVTDETPFLSLFKESVQFAQPKNTLVIQSNGLTEDKTEIIFMERGN